MISINLLPPEYRKAERTPFVIFLPMIAGLICVLSAGAVAGYVKFSWLAETRSEREHLESQMAEKKPHLAYHKNLVAEEAEYKKQAETIKSIARGRILMTRRLDELCDMVAEGDSGQHGGFHIWLEDFKVKPAVQQKSRSRTKGPQSGGEVSFKGYALADRAPLQDFNRFHRAIKNSGMYRDGYIGMKDPEGQVKDFSDDLVPGKGWKFEMSMSLMDPAERHERIEEARKLQAKKEGKERN